MAENENFELDDIIDELTNRVEDIVEDAITDQVEDAVICALQDMLPEVLNECFSKFEFILTDGTIVKPKQHMKLFSPDKSKLLLCCGGLRVDGTSLMVQTRISCWEWIATYPSREEAIEALGRVHRAMEDNLSVFEL
ncbi:MAG: hypothetical protein IKL28_06485 [Lachnospiraceae bacterium]|nr:hypothetical protein [Lachnospiraceae bacterium]